MDALLFDQLPDSARRAIAPELSHDVRTLVVFDASPMLAKRLMRAGAFQRDGILVLPRAHTTRRPR